MPDGESLGITPATNVSTSVALAYNPVFPSLSNAVSIGELTQDTSELNAIGQLSPQVSSDYYSFNFNSGSAMLMAFNNLDNTDGGLDPSASDLRVQVLNSSGTVVADSAGNSDQQTAFNQLTSSGGLSASNGTYYVKVTYADGTTVNPQSYNFQFFSGTTYDTKFVTSALTQPYDPNLFVSAADSMTPASNLQLYTRTATLAAPTSATEPAINAGTLTNNQTELDVSAATTAAIPTDNYNFNVQQGGAVKLTVQNTTNTANLDVQLVDSNGNVVADNNGTTAQQNAYTELTSGEGLQAATGQYTLKVGYASGQLTGSPQSYNFQLNEGTTYNTVYKTSVNQPSTTSTYSAGGNVSVYANSQAQLYSRNDFNTIDATAASAVNIGWLSANTSALNVSSSLTSADNTDYFNFTLQQGNNLKFAFANQTDASALHVQILDSTGSEVIADNQGTAQQKAAFNAITSDSGLAATPGQYIVKVGYAAGASQAKTENYNFQVYSGNSYTNEYQTTVAPESIQTLLLTGGSLGYNQSTAVASLLTSVTGTNGASTEINIFGNASIFNTNIFA
jgi:hypothetical protein